MTLYGSQLIQITNLLGSMKEPLSGRTLTQLPEQSILRYLGEEECTLDMALRFLERSVVQMKATNTAKSKFGVTCEETFDNSPTIQKRKAPDRDELDLALDVIERFVSSSRGVKRIK
jgi:hypothetical protein